ncbi:Pycsar system effector family protein [Joostella sp.]|uniref:Pycsar system effector family protein n=1 Tax=Joostella sp. TaxID=2231138 RepID=UPI003A908A80
MSEIIDKSSSYVKDLLASKLDKRHIYHNTTHTLRVVAGVEKLCEALNVSEEERELVMLAAWFHDTGYTARIDGHEGESCKIAAAYLKEQGYGENKIKEVSSIIMATGMGVKPNNELEMIIKDADSSHLSKDSYINTSEILRQELALTGVKEYTIEEWRKLNIILFTTEHQYYTTYAKENWQQGKSDNLALLVEKDKKEKRRVKKEQLKAQIKGESPERGVQTLYRVALRNHIKLSDIADTKANILLSVNAIIISLALSSLIPKLDSPSNHHLIIPTLILVVFSVASIVFAILSTKPNVTSGEFTDEDVKARKVNLLFFGNFHKVPYDRYERALREMTNDKQYIYDSLTKDLYYLGIVLARKYRLLRTTYTVFMIGIICSVLSFIIAFMSI